MELKNAYQREKNKGKRVSKMMQIEHSPQAKKKAAHAQICVHSEAYRYSRRREK